MKWITEKTRRVFLNWFLGTGVGAMFVTMLYPVLRFLSPPKNAEARATEVMAAQASELKPGSAKIFRFGNEPAILVRTPSSELRAFSAICTHLACTVQYRADLEHIWCACHNGHYDLYGKNIGGPPPRPLPAYVATEKGGKVYVSRTA
ncbi:MAG: ubiquinol-cytochrome c reductase iron-sulfur subunit [Candidatus Tectomicrobia bacterium]|nr:ubiquinol-cytochrome c reductase iron-sulfur subunit [Candidatus Tectomicrobia bacterium]